MAKSNIRAVIAEGQKTFTDSLSELESIIIAEVPISVDDKKGSRANAIEMSKMDFFITNVAKIDEHLPKKFNGDVFSEDAAILKEKQIQLQELLRLGRIVENQIAVKRIGIKSNIKEFYVASKKAAKDDSSLKYIYTTIQEIYAQDVKSTATVATKTAETTEAAALQPESATN
jgi:hypothetical protein